jgi:hypothetical protein
MTDEKRARRRKSGLKHYYAHHEERKAAARARYHKNRKRSRDLKMLRLYSLTQQDYETMVVKQGNKCAICGGPPRIQPMFVIDHDHITGKVRGLLCQPCNVGIGMLQDNLEIVKKAESYLANSQTI